MMKTMMWTLTAATALAAPAASLWRAQDTEATLAEIFEEPAEPVQEPEPAELREEALVGAYLAGGQDVEEEEEVAEPARDPYARALLQYRAAQDTAEAGVAATRSALEWLARGDAKSAQDALAATHYLREHQDRDDAVQARIEAMQNQIAQLREEREELRRVLEERGHPELARERAMLERREAERRAVELRQRFADVRDEAETRARAVRERAVEAERRAEDRRPAAAAPRPVVPGGGGVTVIVEQGDVYINGGGGGGPGASVQLAPGASVRSRDTSAAPPGASNAWNMTFTRRPGPKGGVVTPSGEPVPDAWVVPAPEPRTRSVAPLPAGGTLPAPALPRYVSAPTFVSAPPTPLRLHVFEAPAQTELSLPTAVQLSPPAAVQLSPLTEVQLSPPSEVQLVPQTTLTTSLRSGPAQDGPDRRGPLWRSTPMPMMQGVAPGTDADPDALLREIADMVRALQQDMRALREDVRGLKEKVGGAARGAR
jgi:hypothetical protein